MADEVEIAKPQLEKVPSSDEAASNTLSDFWGTCEATL